MPLDLASELSFLQRHGHDFPDMYTPLEMKLLCILGACAPGAQCPTQSREVAGPLQHLALAHVIVEHFADTYRVTAEPDRLAELTGISEHDIRTKLMPALCEAGVLP